MYLFDYNGATFPAQKKAISKKDKDWRRKCVDGAEALCFGESSPLRQSYGNKRINYNLYSDILDQSDIEKICNPFGLDGLEAPAKIQNYPVCNPRIDLLRGESISRRLPWTVKVINDDAISEKEEQLFQDFMAMVQSHTTPDESGQMPNQEKVKQDLGRFEEYKTYKYQDIRERQASHILNWLQYKEKMEKKWADGFLDVLLSGEEIYLWDIVADEPVFSRLNPLNVFTFASGESNFIEDADIITIVGYMSPGQIVDYYYDELTPSQIDRIESGMRASSEGSKAGAFEFYQGHDRSDSRLFNLDYLANYTSNNHRNHYYEPIDADGNLRVVKVYWKSRRKVQKVTSYDETGQEIITIHDEYYVPDESAGETSSVFWINEWWEGHKIGGTHMIAEQSDSAIYLRMRPKPVQFRSMSNKSKCHPGIVGTIYNTNDNISVSIMDRMKPYQYLYNVIHYNLEIAIATTIGGVVDLDMALIPEGWTEDKWLAYLKNYKINVKDSFKEGQKGVAEGKLAGLVSQNRALAQEVSNERTIRVYIDLLGYINSQIGFISGVSDARLASISNREAVRNVEREITQSSHITEYLFYEHDMTKLRTLEIGLEVAKYCYRTLKNKKMQYILDDGASILFDLDGELLNEADYGIFVTSSREAYELMNTMKSLAQAMLQNDKINVSQLIDIYSNVSPASIKNKLQMFEMKKAEQEQANFEAQQKAQQEAIQRQSEIAMEEINLEYEKLNRLDSQLDRKLANELAKIMLSQEGDTDDKSNADLEKIRQNALKIRQDYELALKDQEIKLKDLSEKSRHNRAMEKKSTSTK
jgi:hypothetical protein